MPGRLSTLLCWVVMLCSLPCAQGNETQNSNVIGALDLRGLPQTLRAKDLTAAWRTISPESLSGWRISRRFDGMPPQPEAVVFYTRGDTITVGTENYLVAYRAEQEQDPVKLQRLQQRAEQRRRRGEKPETRIEENTLLTVSLLNLKSAGNLTNIRAFDPARDILSTAEKLKNKVRDEREDSQSNLRQVGLAMFQYVQDYDEKLPPMRAAKSADQLRNIVRRDSNEISDQTPVQIRLQPYVRNIEIFLHPGTGRPYLPNWRISRKLQWHINNSEKTIMFYEDAPDSEGKRNVLFADRHIEAVDEARWIRMAREAKLPP